MRTLLTVLFALLGSAPALAQAPCTSSIPGVDLVVSPSVAPVGQPISISLANNTNQTIQLPSSCVVRSIFPGGTCTGTAVFSPFCLQVITPIAPGQSLSQPWGQTDDFGAQLPPGMYSVEVQYFDMNFGSFVCCQSFQIGAGSTNSGCLGNGGDGLGCTDCPCGNNATFNCPGGCGHSQSSQFNGCGAELRMQGSPSLANADLCFTLHSAVPNSFAILQSGEALAPANATNPCFAQNPGSGITSNVFDGLRCVVQNTLRHGVRSIDSNGAVEANGVGSDDTWGSCATSPGFSNSSGFAAGQTRHFQAAFRDDPNLVCGTGQNTSQRISVTFAP
ncbi:MAG: hypothetical protein AAF368_13645 [Planctomycetota bacterium]